MTPISAGQCQMWCKSKVWNGGRYVACRVCWRCKEFHRRQWFERFMAAFGGHARTHFVTLTFNPALRGKYVHVQKWLKRCRKAKMRFKYVCVAEPHERRDENGRVRWHYHLLVFTDDDYPTHSMRRLWRGGFTHGRLCLAEDIAYVAKYIGKGDERPRGSNGLWKALLESVEDAPIVQEALRHFPGAEVVRVHQRVRGWESGEYFEEIETQWVPRGKRKIVQRDWRTVEPEDDTPSVGFSERLAAKRY